MPQQLQYTGTQEPYFESAVTGRQRSWYRNQVQDVPDALVAALLATGGFATFLSGQLTPAQAAATQALVSKDGNGATVAIIGDSITDNNYTNGGGIQTYAATGYMTWALMLLGQRLTLVNEGGVGGNKSADVLARLQTDMLAYSPRYGVVMVGINDIFGGLPATTIATNLQSIYTQMRAAGITPVACTVTPGTFPAAQIEQWTALNAWIVDYCRANQWMLLCDSAAAYLSSTDGTPAAGYTSDGIHPVIPGCINIGRALFEVLDPVVPKIASSTNSLMTLATAQKNVLLNGMAWGNNAGGSNGFTLGTGITGTGPNNWFTGRSGTSTAVASKVARTDWRAGEFLRMAVTVAGANEQITCGPQDTVLRYWSSGLVVNAADIVRPTAPNGVGYRVTSGGGLATGSDPTAGWSTTPGATFASGTATLKVVDSIDPGNAFYVQCKAAFSGWSAGFLPVLQLWQYTAGYGSIVKKSIACNWSGADTLPANIPAGTYVLRVPTFTLDPTCVILHVQMGIYGTAGVTGNFDVAEFEMRKDPAPPTFRPGT